MARDLFGVDLGYDIFAENGDDSLASIISGTAIPDGTSGQQQTVSIGSIYLRSGTGELYQKIANAGAPADWELNGSAGSALGNWRPERVDAHTGQVLVAGVTDPTGWSDNDGAFSGTEATVGHYVLDGNCALWEITAVGGATSITLAAAANPPVAQDMFAVRYNLPDPAGQEGQAIITFDGTSCVKVADVDFAFATGVDLAAPYTPVNGDPVAGDSVQLAIEKLDGNQDDLQTLTGVAQGSTDLGTFTGGCIADNVTIKEALQDLEECVEDIALQISGTVPQNTPTNIDCVLVDEAQHVKWIIVARDTANPDRVRRQEINAIHNGHGAADATQTDNSVSERLNIGNVNLQIDVVLTGSGAGQEMCLELETNESSGVNYTIERAEVLPLAG